MIKVLIVEDSPVMQQLLAYTIATDAELEVVGIAGNGEEAIEAVKKYCPDVIAMDWHMPKLDGRQATRIIMETIPTPIVIVSGSSVPTEMISSFSLIEAGALAIVKKPPSIDHPDYTKEMRELNLTLKLMSEVKLVRRITRTPREPQPVKPLIEKFIGKESEIQVVVIGASTGGPMVLQKILSRLPKNLQVPLLIVQHISQGFTEGFVEWLNNTTDFPVHIATDGEYPLPGHAYIAPDNVHMGIGRGSKIILSSHELENGLRPSVAYLFRTTAQVFGSKAVGILLTGMGRDGADDLKLMKDRGAVTFAQDKESSIVYGMPGEAEKLNAATFILPPDDIITALISLIKNKNGELYEKQDEF